MQKIVVSALVLGVCLFAAGCANKSSFLSMEKPPAVEATTEQVRSCQYVGEISGKSKLRSPATSAIALRSAQQSGLQQAGAKGATHVVWVGKRGGRNPVALGKAYKCPR
ncbi:hypothetical protein [Dethiosulfatarculus sandiegensis]|uniref:DUF4156 domain-containing protein n=1 Tax=Dethiosulfatarculus sandiegensis TaxID=1429043 RepID=A0A0D2GG96_9BACT|nr:hypothetical protein [Dethiosulfatarculus sandiegensis]KIX13927.1 hypothetical protein X474_12220 [Dethiosulfatarculus sandiegensis]